MKKVLIFSFALLSLFSWNCESNGPAKPSRVVIGIPADAETLNPLFAVSMIEGQINEILYLSLVKHNWDDDASDITSAPLLCEKWEWEKDSTAVTFTLREDAYWSDGVKVSSDDIIFSFDLYSDPEVNSKFFGSYDKLFTEKNQHIDLKKSFEILSPTKFKVNFKPRSKPSLFDIDMPIIPKHVYSKIPRQELSKTNIEKNLVSNGPYTLASWKKNEAIILKSMANSFLYNEKMVKELVFKVVPDENSRLTQLKRGEMDLVEDMNVEAIADLKKLDQINLVARVGRDYDYIGWNNIDPELYSKFSGINPNKFFGNPNVRRALSYAINKEEILKEYLQGYGRLSFGPISPIFKAYYNDKLKPYVYDPSKAKEILKSEGWVDINQNGIIEKDKSEFSFKLYIASGNPRRIYAATVVKNNLKAIGINVLVESLEMGTFINKLFERELDAYMAGWTVAIPIDIQPYWHSSFERSPFNLVGYSNSEIDEILDELEQETNHAARVALYKKAQQLIHQDEPVTFLYWLDVITAYNKRITNITVDPLGAIQLCWEWRLND